MYYFYVALSIVVGYLLGSINSAVIISRLFFKEDIREKGSKNAGLTNMLRVYGAKAAAFTFIGDFCKGIIAVCAGYIMGDMLFACLGGGFAVLGHVFPAYFGFKGGKGVLTAFSVMIVICPLPTLVALAIFIIIVVLTRFVSLGSILAAASIPFITYFLGDKLFSRGGLSPVFFLACALAVVIIVKHHANIVRLVTGKESKLSLRKKQ
ncbi:MAG: glycerol-3-phosphate 1-O-acyltransferase PlsY [Clostridia bacterium]|nr:glycerol-3-phosphate 1-O-acyltransferase PlsY [Clostridia bacterium]